MRIWLRNMRHNSHLTQKDIANKIGISLKSYNKIELGKLQQDLNLSTMVKLSEIFNITLDEIKFFEGYKQKEEEKDVQNKISEAMKVLS